jgi:hypothetical protein
MYHRRKERRKSCSGYASNGRRNGRHDVTGVYLLLIDRRTGAEKPSLFFFLPEYMKCSRSSPQNTIFMVFRHIFAETTFAQNCEDRLRLGFRYLCSEIEQTNNDSFFYHIKTGWIMLEKSIL